MGRLLSWENGRQGSGYSNELQRTVLKTVLRTALAHFFVAHEDAYQRLFNKIGEPRIVRTGGK